MAIIEAKCIWVEVNEIMAYNSWQHSPTHPSYVIVNPIQTREVEKDMHALTLKRAPMEENLDDFDDSSGSGGKRPTTKEHFEAVNNAWCSATT